VDLLAVEFNHDVRMQRTSGRHPRLIARILGGNGHLSNEQAAQLVEAVRERSAARRLKQVVQLHLSRQCNSPALARAAARRVLGDSVRVHTARQHRPGPWLSVAELGAEELVQAWLPGW
jgi:phosphoribosyl 1,2-cyclic phosphodiesterase